MKKLLTIFIITIFVLLVWILNESSDYKGYILAVKETSLIINVPASNPMDDWPTYEIFLTEDTEIEGKSDSLNGGFRAGDEVRVWVEEKVEVKKIAKKIIIDVYGNNTSSEGER